MVQPLCSAGRTIAPARRQVGPFSALSPPLSDTAAPSNPLSCVFPCPRRQPHPASFPSGLQVRHPCPRRRPVQPLTSPIRHYCPSPLPEAAVATTIRSLRAVDAAPTSNLAHTHGRQITLPRTPPSTRTHGRRPGSTARRRTPPLDFYVNGCVPSTESSFFLIIFLCFPFCVVSNPQ
jgi:hypothetical protein